MLTEKSIALFEVGMEGLDIDDQTNLTGLFSLLNESKVDREVDGDTLERQWAGNVTQETVEELDPAEEFKSIIKGLSDDIGIDLDSEDTEIPTSPSPQVDLSFLDTPETFSRPEPYRSEPSRLENRPVSTPYHNRPTSRPKSNYIDDALDAYSGGKSDLIETEKEEDDKAQLLDDIDELKTELAKDKVDLSRIPEVNQDSAPADIRLVHRILRLKYDRKRCNNLGTEIILALAQIMGHIFNGKRQIGPFRPNLEGWHNTARAKLRHLRYDTSTIVAQVMRDYDIGPFTRVAIELGPSALLYSYNRNEQQGHHYSPTQMSEAYDHLQDLED